MKWASLITAALLPLTCLAAGKVKAKPDTFEGWHAQQVSNGGGNPIKIDDDTYAALTKTPRDYSVVVLFTALDVRHGCVLCREFQGEWDFLARSWTKGDKSGESKLVFSTLDFSDGKKTFASFELQTAPIVMLFPPTTGPHAKPNAAVARYEFGSGSNRADPVHAWLTRQLPNRPHPPLSRPINVVRVAVTVTAVLGAISFFSVTARWVLPVLQNRNLWAAISLIAILLFTSGQMFNHIRTTPYVGGNGRGGVSYFAGGFSNQFGIETQIVAAMYGILAFATISLALKVPRMADPNAQQIAIFIWIGVLLGTYSYFLSVFRIKNGGYPFWLPPF